MNDLIMLGGLWLNESQSGQTYMSGRLGLGGKVLIFKNQKKENDNEPDYYLMLAEWSRTEKGKKGDSDDIPF
jgi:uncharacterized protein (DUF736 family)